MPLRTISAAESRAAVTGGDPLIRQYETRKLSDRRQEQITLEGGFITASFMDSDSFMNSNVTPDRYLMDIWIKPVLHSEKGIPISENMIKEAAYQNGELFYATGRSSDETCFVFNSVFWTKSPVHPLGQGDTNVRGGVCLPHSHPLAGNLEQHMLDLLMRMRFS